MKLYHKRKCKAAVGSTTNLVSSKVGVRKARFEELKALEDKLPQAVPEIELKVVFINLDPSDIEQLQCLGVESTEPHEAIQSDAWKEVLALFSSKRLIDVVVLKLQGEELQDIERCIISLCFMKSCPAVVLAKPDTSAEAACRDLTAGTLPVYSKLQDVAESLKTKVPRTLLLRQLVQEDIASKVEDCKKLNLVKHFGKRAAVALIPFAVQAVNFAGVLRLVKRMMKVTGMVTSKQVAKTVTKFSAVATLKAAAIDQVGDVYQYAVAATILADVGASLAAEGVSAALSTLDAVDFALLGSVSLVTGTLSALGAYLTRPQLVDCISKFLATLQVIYLLNPNMRRPEDAENAGASSGSSEDCDEDEELLVLERSVDSQSLTPLIGPKQKSSELQVSEDVIMPPLISVGRFSHQTGPWAEDTTTQSSKQ